MIGHADYIDDELLAQAEREAMVRPSNSAMWDDRLYTTHAPVMSWAERGDDILAESNYLSALDALNGAAAWTDREDQDDVIDATISGSLRQLFIRVRDDAGAFTPTWREAVRIGLALQDYPVLDESDYSEREWKRYEDDMSEALNSTQCQYDEDTTEQTDAILERFWTLVQNGETETRADEGADWDAVADLYRQARDAHFLPLAHEHWTAQLDGQGELL